MNIALWIMQGLLALLFLFSGGVKLVLPMDQLVKQAPQLSGSFLRFVGVCEVLGGLGLILPWMLRIRPVLTPVAAIALIGIMIGAVAVTLPLGIVNAILPAVVGFILAFVAYGRWRSTP